MLITGTGRGFVISEVEGQTTRNGKPMARFATAHNKSRKDEQTGEWERTHQAVINWTAFGPLAETVLGAVDKMTEVEVTGEIYEDEWTGDDGVTRKSLKGNLKSVGPVEPREPRNSGGFQGGSAWQ